jgi:trehalose synthase-fused probable maltokinase
MAPRPAIDRRLQRLASAFTPDWLAAQRWFRGKSRGLERVELIDAAQLGESSGWLLVLEATDGAGAGARYQVPAVLADGTFGEPGDGDGLWQALAGLMLDGGDVAGTRGRWEFTSTSAANAILANGRATLPALPERRLGGQQSNTSVALGEALILKIYRLVEPALNPEVEVNAFLTGVGFREAPALAGSAVYLLDGKVHSVAMLQQFVPASGDGWSWVLDRLASPPDGPAQAIEAVAQIGRLTDSMHAALASRPEAPGFPSRHATSEELVAWGASARQQLSAALDALEGDDLARLTSAAPRIVAALGAIEVSAGASVSRIHGDYHLGQLLRTADGFVVIDFEGEPARSMAERRAPASPLRDLAGMLRSLDYAGHAAGRAEWTGVERTAWIGEARAAFLDAYGGISPQETPLLAAFELEKACYEVAYEANNRPDWIWLPLGALDRLAG